MPVVSLAPNHLLIDDVPTLIQAGTLQYYRLPHRIIWKSSLEQLRVAGFNTVMISFPWSYHSPAEGYFDFTGPRDIPYLLEIVADTGLWLIAHIGPWVGSHLSAGGIPSWSMKSLDAEHSPTTNSSQGYPATFYRHLESWWQRLFPQIVKFPNLLFTVMHPGRWSYPTNLDLHKKSLINLAVLSGLRQHIAWPAHQLAQIPGDELPSTEVWRVEGLAQEVLAETTSRAQPFFAITQVGQPVLNNNLSDEQILRQLPENHPRRQLADLLTTDIRIIALDPGHYGCNWGLWGSKGLASVYGIGAPLADNYGKTRYYENTRNSVITAEIFSKILLAPEMQSSITTSPVDLIRGAISTQNGSLAILESKQKESRDIHLLLSVGDMPIITDDIHLKQEFVRLLPLNLQIAGGIFRASTMEVIMLTEVAGRTLCILRNEHGGKVRLSDDFRPVHIRGKIRSNRNQSDWMVDFQPERLSSILFEGPDHRLQLLALGVPYADRVWALDDAWRTSPFYNPNWASTSEDPVRGIIIGPDLVVPATEGQYRFLVSSKGFGYRWGPWHGSDPRTWLAPISWRVPTCEDLPELNWEQTNGALELSPDFPDASWPVLPLDGSFDAGMYDSRSTFTWYRGIYSGNANTLEMHCTQECDVFLNGRLIAAIKNSPETNAIGQKSIPLPLRYQNQRNTIAILVENSGQAEDLDHAQQQRGLLFCRLNPNITTQWRVHEGLLGEKRVQGFYGYADWKSITSGGTSDILWHRTTFSLQFMPNIVRPVFLVIEPTPTKNYIYLNGVLIGRTWANNTPQRRFWLPQGLLNQNGQNEILIAQWTRGAEPRLGHTRLESGTAQFWHLESSRAQ